MEQFPDSDAISGELEGFEIKVINAITAETGDQVNIVTMSFSGLIDALQSSRINIIANPIPMIPNHSKKLAFLQLDVYCDTRLVVRYGDEGTIKDATDLSGEPVAINLGSNFEVLMNARLVPYLQSSMTSYVLMIGVF